MSALLAARPTPTTFVVTLDGVDARLDFRQVVERNRSLLNTTHDTKRDDRDALMAWGHYLNQLKPQFPHGRWGAFLNAEVRPFKHRASMAMRMAREAGGADGRADEAKIELAVKAHNATAAQLGHRPIRDNGASAQSVQIALRIREPIPAKVSARKNMNARDGVVLTGGTPVPPKAIEPDDDDPYGIAAADPFAAMAGPIGKPGSESRGTQGLRSQSQVQVVQVARRPDVVGQMTLASVYERLEDVWDAVEAGRLNRSLPEHLARELLAWAERDAKGGR